jgi:hypothetical protein
MPDGVSGREIAHRLQTAKPQLKVLFNSGDTTERTEPQSILQAGAIFCPNRTILKSSLKWCAPVSIPARIP